MGKVLAVCISEKKGTQKKNVGSAVFVEDWGLEGDAHAGKWHRQVSLLSYNKVEEFNKRGANVSDGAFGENLVVDGIDFVRRAQRSRMVLLVRTWLWKGLILQSFRLAPDFVAVRLCWS